MTGQTISRQRNACTNPQRQYSHLISLVFHIQSVYLLGIWRKFEFDQLSGSLLSIVVESSSKATAVTVYTSAKRHRKPNQTSSPCSQNRFCQVLSAPFYLLAFARVGWRACDHNNTVQEAGARTPYTPCICTSAVLFNVQS